MSAASQEEKIDLNKYWHDKPAVKIVDSLYYLTLCEHQAVLSDNAVCIHNRMLSDDVLRCSGVNGWRRGNFMMYLNKRVGRDYRYIYVSSVASVQIAVYQCIYTRGQWKRACGEIVDQTISIIVNKFIQIVKG